MNGKANLQEYTLLVIDDKPSNLGVITDALEESGFEIMVARNGKTGCELAAQAKPDLILLDVMMPEMDGFETCRCLKAEKETRNIPVIFMTALTDVVDKVKGFEVGAVDYITKPIQFEELFARMSTHLHIRKLQTQIETQNSLLGEQNTLLTQEILEHKQAEVQLQAAHNKLEKTLKDLKRTQTQLVESEKMAALGKLVVNTTHEINAPIGRIRSSIGTVSQILDQILAELPTFFHSLSEKRQHDFFALLKIALQKDTTHSAREDDECQRTLMKTLQEYQLDSNPDIAEILVNIGVYKNIQPFIPFLKDPNHSDIVKMVYYLSELHESAHNTIIAIDEVSKIVFALKTYTHPDQRSDKMVEADIGL
jgi:DNA-binding response OmpR family regulator